MSVSGRPAACPSCGSAELAEFGRVEAGELGGGWPGEDLALYVCGACGAECDSSDR